MAPEPSAFKLFVKTILVSERNACVATSHLWRSRWSLRLSSCGNLNSLLRTIQDSCISFELIDIGMTGIKLKSRCQLGRILECEQR